MDSPADWAANALFSPSKARAQQAQAKDWAFTDAWLARKYGKRVPAFERNEKTLQALLTLATLNEGADEQRSLIEKVEKTTHHQSTKRRQEHEDAYVALLESLRHEGDESLNTLAESAALLGTSDVVHAGRGICNLTAAQFELGEQFKRADAQQAAFRREQARLTAIMQDLKQQAFKAPDNLPAQTAEWTRSAKHLKAKVAEYDERLSTLRGVSPPSPSFEDVAQNMQDLESQRERYGELNNNLAALESLPSDPKAARAKLESARAELRNLSLRRDKLFEQLVDSR